MHSKLSPLTALPVKISICGARPEGGEVTFPRLSFLLVFKPGRNVAQWFNVDARDLTAVITCAPTPLD